MNFILRSDLACEDMTQQFLPFLSSLTQLILKNKSCISVFVSRYGHLNEYQQIFFWLAACECCGGPAAAEMERQSAIEASAGSAVRPSQDIQ